MSTPKSNPEVQKNKEEKRIDYCEKIYSQVNSWIENADNKVSVSCGILTGVFAIITFLAEKVTRGVTINFCWHRIYLICFGTSMLTMGTALFFYILAINPNLGSESKSAGEAKKNKAVLLYYGDIAKLSVDEYKQLMKKSEEKAYFDELLGEIHYNSVICEKKMKNFRKGLWLSFGAIGIAALSWISHILSF